MELPKVGYHRRLSAEGLLALRPTKVIGSDEMGPKTTLSQLKSAGVDVEIVNTDANVEGLYQRIDQIANLMDRKAQAESLKQDVQAQVQALNANQPDQAKKKKVLFLLIHEGRPANVAGSQTTPMQLFNSPADKTQPLHNSRLTSLYPQKRW